MNSLMSYGSDDDLDDSPEERTVDSHGRSLGKSSGTTPPNDTNYDEVQMSLSEDSDVESKQNPKSRRDRDDQRSSPKNRDSKETGQRDRRDDRSERDRYTGRDRNDDRNRRDRDDDRSRNRDEKEERGKSRDDDKTRDRYRDREEDRRDARRDDRRARSRDRYNSREDRHRQDRDRRRSRSPRDNRERKRSRSPKKSRSRSKERPNRTGAFQRRFDRGNRNIDQRQSNVATETAQNDDGQNKDRFFMPGITGRFRDQIEKRKLLWQKKEPGENPAPAAGGAPSSAAQNPHAPKSTKIWQNTTFAQDTDGKVANKFKRLMGIRAPGDGENSANEALKKQDEMFSAMEQQYEVARTTTHTMRGVGLGFSSFNR